ncbi:MAG: NAD(P)-dependent alcohol dehydrogenase [Acidimicrobiales bacterium]
MKGIVQTEFGDPRKVLRLETMEQPPVDDDSVLVRVCAASIHIGAVYGVRGFPKVMRPMFKKFIADSGVIGQNLAGVVEAVGRNVTSFAVGDEVFGSATGAFAEYAIATPDALGPKPANLDFEHASALGVSAFTALQGLTTYGHLTAGQHVLITGASGGVGSFAVQIAKALGSEVTAVCSTRNIELVRSIGADHVIDYTANDFTTGAPTYDLIFDNVGGHPLKAMRSVLTADGRLLANGAPAPTGWLGGLGHPLRVAIESLFSRQQARPFLSTENAADLRRLHDMAAAGTITPVIDRIAPLDEAIETIAAVGEGHNRGTSVIVIPTSPQARH